MTYSAKTSHFITFSPALGGLPGTAAVVFSASTVDEETTLTKAGYVDVVDEDSFFHFQWVANQFVHRSDLQSDLN